MAAKTFLPRLLDLLRATCRYITRYELTIRENIPPEHEDKLDAVLVACAALAVVLDEIIPTGV